MRAIYETKKQERPQVCKNFFFFSPSITSLLSYIRNQDLAEPVRSSLSRVLQSCLCSGPIILAKEVVENEIDI